MKFTMNHIAKEAHVAQSTVSLVVNKKNYVSEETRQKVQKVIDELGFRPHVAARELVSSKIENIAFVLNLQHKHLSGEPFFTKILEGVDTELPRYGYHMVFVTSGQMKNTDNENIALNVLKESRVGGVIIGGQTDERQIKELIENKYPVVLLQRDVTAEKVSCVCADDVDGAYNAVGYLSDLGHKRIAFIGTNISQSIQKRFKGYRMALEDKGIEYDNDLVVDTEKTIEGGYQSAQEILKRFGSMQPTAIFAVTDQIAIGVMRAVRDKGLRIPEDVSVVGFDDIEIAQYLEPPLTTVRIFKEKMGALAVKLLIEIIHGDVSNGHGVVVPTELVIRESCASVTG